jgi:hypothetical protein
MSEWGNPAWVMPGDPRCCRREEASPGTETSQYREEKTSTEIPQVVASERGRSPNRLTRDTGHGLSERG